MTNKEIAIKLLESRKRSYESMKSKFVSDFIVKEYEVKLEVVNELLDEFQKFLQDEES